MGFGDAASLAKNINAALSEGADLGKFVCTYLRLPDWIVNSYMIYLHCKKTLVIVSVEPITSELALSHSEVAHVQRSAAALQKILTPFLFHP